MSTTHHLPDDDRDRPTTAQEIIDEHGRETLAAMAADGNIGAEKVLELADGDQEAEQNAESDDDE